MRRLDYVRRIWITELNTIIEKINQIIDKLNQEIEIEEVVISKEVKDFKFFNWEEVALPYHAQYTLGKVEDATKAFSNYTLSYKEMKNINDLLLAGKIVSLIIDVTEGVTEKEKKQEAMFEVIKTIPIDIEIKNPPKKKRGRKPKKKTSWN